ncbi:bestrophin family protein [Fulvivirga ligni]|uniref:bestrophin family protein n=1 Tax=Fulvivirga ligni TaxID=2904246 RepID=UPI001F3D97A7|nr:bestrophin family ion channel [Fulvivirga ligni]UII20210.1 hypothetical protein LVD16_20395 [Fulvivirga ligni]
MIKYNPKTWFSLIFHSYSRQVVRLLFPALVFMAIYSLLAAYLVLEVFQWNFKSTTAVHSLLGIVLGLFLVFRVNSAYDRWWEGRKLWGLLVNNSRNLAFKVASYLPDDHEARKYFAVMIPNFVVAVKEHLRKGVDLKALDLSEIGVELEGKEHIPNYISYLLHRKINALYKEGIFTGDHFLVLDAEMKMFSDILGGCERIKNTPIPYSYSMYIKKFIFTFTITLPFAFITDFGYLTVPIVLMIFFILVSVELIAEEIEDPFGKDVNDLPTEELSTKIKSNVQEILL